MNQPKIGIKTIVFSQASGRVKVLKLIDYFLGTFVATILPSQAVFFKKQFKASRILIIRPGGIGDAIFLIPAIKEIKKQLSGIEIDVLCEKRNRQVFYLEKDLVRNIYCREKIRDMCVVFNNTYDVIFDSEQWHYLSAVFASFLKSKIRVGFATRPLRKKLFNCRIDYDVNAYELDNFKNLFGCILKKNAGQKDINNCISIAQQEVVPASCQISSDYAVFAIGASIPARKLRSEQIKKVVNILIERNLNVVLLGGKEAVSLGQCIDESLNDERVHNYTGKTSLAKSADLIRNSKLFIGSDSGIMHLACAVGTPVQAIFGPGNKNKWGPQGEKHLIVSKGLECSPCTVFGYTNPTCKRKYLCMQDIDMKQFFDSIKRILC
ncbi:MAG: glycosyltransferase family 9 protein [Candidatus Aceula meridiana]|nr:glycosyltransferase family 9 protein [Candidatus Aceula meridiana]